MKLLLFTCAGSFSVDQQSNLVSVFNIVEQVASPVFPCVLSDLHLIAVVRREQNEGDLNLGLVGTLNARELFNDAFMVRFSQSPVARGFGHVRDLTISEPGTLRFVLQRGKRKWGEWAVDITEQPPLQRSVAADASSATSPDVAADISDRRKPKSRASNHRLIN